MTARKYTDDDLALIRFLRDERFKFAEIALLFKTSVNSVKSTFYYHADPARLVRKREREAARRLRQKQYYGANWTYYRKLVDMGYSAAEADRMVKSIS
jgi:hypothetical protein